LNDAGTLDLVEAFSRRKAHYVANTGYSWGSAELAPLSEGLMVQYTRELQDGLAVPIGKALSRAKQRYYQTVAEPGAYDANVLMQTVLYGLPMYTLNSPEALGPDDAFPSVRTTRKPSGTLGDVIEAQYTYELSGEFDAFQTTIRRDGAIVSLDNSVHVQADEPVQPFFYQDIPPEGSKKPRGILFRSAIYSDVYQFDPLVTRPYNERVANEPEPAFAAAGWHPTLPLQLRTGASELAADATIVSLMGQYHARERTERLYSQIVFDLLYSDDVDTVLADIISVAGIQDTAGQRSAIKVEAVDNRRIDEVVVAYTDGQGTWQSQNLEYDQQLHKWIGDIPAANAAYFVQVVDEAGNVARADNKGQYYQISPFVELVAPIENRDDGGNGTEPEHVYLPLVIR
jgi:hypothetical protein